MGSLFFVFFAVMIYFNILAQCFASLNNVPFRNIHANSQFIKHIYYSSRKQMFLFLVHLVLATCIYTGEYKTFHAKHPSPSWIIFHYLAWLLLKADWLLLFRFLFVPEILDRICPYSLKSSKLIFI